MNSNVDGAVVQPVDILQLFVNFRNRSRINTCSATLSMLQVYEEYSGSNTVAVHKFRHVFIN